MTVAAHTVLELGYLPPSMNATMYAHWSRQRTAKRQLQADLELLLMASRVPRPVEYVAASAVLVVPDRRRRDEGNYRTPLEKALGDALVNGGWLDDDTPDRFRFGDARFEHQPGRRAARIRVAWREGAEG